MNSKLVSALALVGLVAGGQAYAATVVFDFEGVNIPAVSTDAAITNYYNGGMSTSNGPGPNYGAVFGGRLIALSNDSPDFPIFSNQPAPDPGNVMSLSGIPTNGNTPALTTINMAGGFVGQVSFYYSAAAAVPITVWSGLDGNGTLLGEFTTDINANTGGCDDSPFCHWGSDGLIAFNGVAKSIQFGGVFQGDYAMAGFDNITVNAVPLPAAAWLLMSGLGAVGALSRRKRAAAVAA